MCIKTDNRIECEECEYPGTEARHLNDGTITHDSTQGEVDEYLNWLRDKQ